jgi:outer membrane scaffolding protein for murein synthesis (MipA/OmpV family)
MPLIRSNPTEATRALATFGLGLIIAGPAIAEERVEEEIILDLSVGGGVAYAPDYEGSDDYELALIPYAELSLYDGLATLSPGGLEVTAPLGSNIFVGAGLGYDGGRDEGDNDALNGLGDVDGSFIGSISGGLALGPAQLGLTFTHDLGSGHEGYTVDLDANTGFEIIEDKANISLGVGATWASKNYTEAYFGISAAQAAASGLNQFNTSAGLKSSGVRAGAGYALTDYASLQLELGYLRLLGDAADSPIVDQLGSQDQFFTGLVLALRLGLL